MREENIDKMNFKELRNEVQYLRDELAILTRKFNDAIYNLDSDNFGKSFTVAQDNMKAQIKINAKEIATKVSEDDLTDKLSSYSTINQTASAISSAVTTINNNLTTNYSTITQTADKIRSVVASNAFNNAVEVLEWLPAGKDKGKIYVVRGTPADTYYYYNAYDEEWKTSSGHDLYTVFEQTDDKFYLKGNVVVDGSLVAGEITGIDIAGVKFYSLEYDSLDNPVKNHYMTMVDSQGIDPYGNFRLYSKAPSPATGYNCYFGIYNDSNSSLVSLIAKGHPFLDTGISNGKATVDFSRCSSIRFCRDTNSGVYSANDIYFGNSNIDFSKCNISWGNNPIAKFG